MNGEKEFFQAEVEFTSVGESFVELAHPDLVGKQWTMKNVAGWIGGACLAVVAACATQPKVTPLEAAALEWRQTRDVERVAAQDLGSLATETRALIDRLRAGEPTGGPALREQTSHRFGPAAAKSTVSEAQAIAATARFIVRNS